MKELSAENENRGLNSYEKCKLSKKVGSALDNNYIIQKYQKKLRMTFWFLVLELVFISLSS